MRISQHHDYKRLKKYPLDIAFSEKELIFDIQGDCRGSAEIDKIIDGKIIGSHEETRKFTKKGSRAVLGQAKLALRFQIPSQASLPGIVKTHRALAARMVLLLPSTARRWSLDSFRQRLRRDLRPPTRCRSYGVTCGNWWRVAGGVICLTRYNKCLFYINYERE